MKRASTGPILGPAAIRGVTALVFLSGAVFTTMRLSLSSNAASLSLLEPLGATVDDASGAGNLKLGPALAAPAVKEREGKTDTCDDSILCSSRPGLVSFNKDRLVTSFVHDGHGVGQLFAVVNSGVSVALASNRSLDIHFAPGHETKGTLHGASIDDWLTFFGMQRQERGERSEQSLPFQIHRNSTPRVLAGVLGYSGDEEVCDDKLHATAASTYVNRTICHIMNPDTACFWRGLFWRNNQQALDLQAAPRPLSQSNEIRVSVHIRQGDIYKSRIWKRRRMNPEYYKSVLRQVLEALKANFPSHKVHAAVFSNRGPLSAEDMHEFLLAYLPESQIYTKMQSADRKGEVFKDMMSFIASDIFIGAKSQASLTSAFLHRGISILPKWPPYTFQNGEIPDILELEPRELAADFDSIKFVEGVKRRLACRATSP